MVCILLKAMEKHNGGVANYRTSEGKCVSIPYKGKTEELIKDSKGNFKKVLRKENFKGLKVEEGLKLNGIVFK